jgi:hypothetical protein
MHNQQPDNRGFFDRVNDSFNLLVLICSIWTYPLIAILRKPGTCGDRFFSGWAAVGLLWIGVFITLAGGPGEEPFALAAWGVCIFFLLLHRAKGIELRKKGYDVHSRYDGIPWIKGGDELKVKSTHEPALLFLAGALSLTFSLGLGGYLLIGGFCLAMVTDHYRLRMEARERAIRDAEHEQQLVMDRRRKGGE